MAQVFETIERYEWEGYKFRVWLNEERTILGSFNSGVQEVVQNADIRFNTGVEKTPDAIRAQALNLLDDISKAQDVNAVEITDPDGNQAIVYNDWP